MDILLTVFVPCVEVMRLADGKKGVTLGKFYAAMLGLGGEGVSMQVGFLVSTDR